MVGASIYETTCDRTLGSASGGPPAVSPAPAPAAEASDVLAAARAWQISRVSENSGVDSRSRSDPAAATPPGRSVPELGRALHLGVYCDGCGANPIEGTRYSRKLGKGQYLDLCARDFLRLAHVEQRLYEEIRVPQEVLSDD